MSKKSKCPNFWGKNILIILIVIGFYIGGRSIFEAKIQKIEANLAEFSIEEILGNRLPIVQGNSLLSASNYSNPVQVVRKIKVIVTAYSSSPFETDDNPYITAAGTLVREGVVANNLLPFGTKIRIPEIYGDKVFVVEDRMHWKKGYYHVDIWFPSYWQALNFGSKRAYIEMLEG
ncbi:3D domain-containing protein [Patescibacteria group bacterium]|nr:3D domain-containing protein [Patescibacteria group bacterium]